MTIDEEDLKKAPGAAAEIAPPRPAAARPRKSVAKSEGSWLKRHRRLLGFGLGALIIVGVLLAFVLPKLSGDAAANYTLAPVTRGDIEATVTALGNVQPKNYVDVGAQVSGQIKALHVNIGDQVKKGDLLVEIDAQVQQARVEADQDSLAALQQQLVDQQAQLALKKAQYERQVRLDQQGATSKDDLQTAKAAYDSATAQSGAVQAQIKQSQSSLQADQVTLGYAKIAAPMDGTIVSLPARLGMTINSVQQAPTLLRVADLSLMEIWTQVSEADVAKLHVGMPAYFTTLGNPNRRYNGTLSQILPTPETVNNVILYDVLFDVPNPDGSLMTQMTAQVFFVTASAKNVLMVPAAAVHPLNFTGRRPGAHGGQGRGGAGGAGTGAGAAGAAGGAGAGNRSFNRGAGGNAPSGGGASSGAPASEVTSEATQAGGQGGNASARAARRQAFAATHGIVEVMGAGGKIERRMVETGVSDRVNTEIKSGLKEGEQVVVGEKQAAGAPKPANGANGRPPIGGPGAMRVMVR